MILASSAYWVSAGSYCFDSFCCGFGFAEGGWPGLVPAGEVLFFASPKKSTQKKGDPQSATPALRYGANLRWGACGVRRITHCAPAALRSDKCGESVHKACALRRACPPRKRPAAGAARRGWKEDGPSLRSAPKNAGAARRACQAKRSDGTEPAKPFCPCREAQGVGRACAAGHTPSRSDLLRLFERSCVAAQ